MTKKIKGEKKVMKKMFFNLASAIYLKKEEFKQKTEGNKLIANENGDGFAVFIILFLIVVVVGATIYNNYTGFMSELWTWAINKVKSTFGM